MYNTDHYQHLKKQLDSTQNTVALRCHRVNSWLCCANSCYDDDDKFYVFSWIAFNAMYGSIDNALHNERNQFKVFFKEVLSLDTQSTIYDILWVSFTNQVRGLLNNQYIFEPFWKHTQGVRGYDNWEYSFKREKSLVNKALSKKNTLFILGILFDRMYVLRNQILHGSATYESKINRPQLITSRKILERVLPIFMEIILQNPDAHWGQTLYNPQ